MPKQIKLSLEDLKVQSFVTTVEKQAIKGGLINIENLTGNCLSFIRVTCPEPCDFQSIPLDECDPC